MMILQECPTPIVSCPEANSRAIRFHDPPLLNNVLFDETLSGAAHGQRVLRPVNFN